MKTINWIVPTTNVKKSFNIKQDINIYMSRLKTILSKIIKGCGEFDKCPICQCDYSVQFLDIAICILYEDGIIDKETKENIMCKLYDGHRG